MAYNDSTPSHETHYNQATLRVRSLNKAGDAPYTVGRYVSTISTVYGYLFIYL